MSATTRVSVANDGTQSIDWSYGPAISGDENYIAFGSDASNLVPGDHNNTGDIFLRDRLRGTTTRVSISTEGIQGNGYSSYPAMNEDGSYVAFESWSSNLVSGDTNNTSDIFVRDRLTETTTRVSIATDGTQSNNWSYDAAISNNGNYVVFTSSASNLVEDDSNNNSDIFLRDRLSERTTKVSISSDGTQGNYGSFDPDISGNGLYVVFQSWSNNLVPGDTNSFPDIFVHELETGITTRVTVSSEGTQGNGWSYYPTVSSDGRYIAFESLAKNLVSGDTNNTSDVFVHDRLLGTTTRVSVSSDGIQGNYGSYNPNISDDGRYVAFTSEADNLVAEDTNNSPDIFVHDLVTSITTRVNITSDGSQSNNWSYNPVLSGNGQYVAFESYANNLVPEDTNNATDIFLNVVDTI